MKRFYALFLALVVFVSIGSLSLQAAAQEEEELFSDVEIFRNMNFEPDDDDAVAYGDNDFDSTGFGGSGGGMSTQGAVAGLISSRSAGVFIPLPPESANSTKILVDVSTVGFSGVTKTGVLSVKLQRCAIGSSTYSDWGTMSGEDLVSGTNYYTTFVKYINSGYYYRAVVEHHAYKTKYLVLKDYQTVVNTTGGVRM